MLQKEKNLNLKLQMFERKQENVRLQIFARESITSKLLKVSGVSKKKYYVRPLLQKETKYQFKAIWKKTATY